MKNKDKLSSWENGKPGQLWGSTVGYTKSRKGLRKVCAGGEEQELAVKDVRCYAQPMVLRASFSAYPSSTPVLQEGTIWKWVCTGGLRWGLSLPFLWDPWWAWRVCILSEGQMAWTSCLHTKPSFTHLYMCVYFVTVGSVSGTLAVHHNSQAMSPWIRCSLSLGSCSSTYHRNLLSLGGAAETAPAVEVGLQDAVGNQKYERLQRMY